MAGSWTAIIINYNGAGFIEACVQALETCVTRPSEIIVVDNGSTDDSLLEMHAFPRVQVFAQGRNLGFAGGANAGLEAVETDYAVILNPDVEVNQTFGTHLIAAFTSNPRLGAAGPLLLYPDGETVQHAGGMLERPLMTTRHHAYGERLDSLTLAERAVDFVTGGAMALRMDAVHEIGGVDDTLAPVYYEDVDLCFRLRERHWEVKFVPALRALHHEGVTLQRSAIYYHYLHRNRVKFALKHLSASEWSTRFVPAEIARIRGELQHLDQEEWLTVSGANAIEGLLRSASDWQPPPLLQSSQFDAARQSLDETSKLWEVTGKPPGSRIPLAGTLRNLINSLGPRQALDAALTEQRAFNAAVVRALEAQDRLHREQTATVLLIALDTLQRSRDNSAS
ncbi:hypothetical protein BH24CHL1_BH24CHL1_00960 [soil metagenome]